MKGYGFATLPDKPATPESLWCGGSTAKGFTAASLAHLIDSKKYSSLLKGWATPISSIHSSCKMKSSRIMDEIGVAHPFNKEEYFLLSIR